MLKALIADDELNHRLGLMRHVHWEKLGYAEPLLAEDAGESLQIAADNPVDVLIADVCMPGIDGIELVREMRNHLPRLHVLIISGYEEFEFARAAVEAGARAYLLKPLRIEEVEQWLQTFREENEMAEKIAEADIQMKKKLNSSLQIARERFLEELLQETDIEEEETAKWLELLDLPTTGAFRVILLSLDDYTVLKARDPGESTMALNRIKDTMKIVFGEVIAIETEVSPNRLATLLVYTKDKKAVSLDEIESRIKIMKESLQVSFSACVSREGSLWENVRHLYWEAENTLRTAQPYEKGQVLFSEYFVESGNVDQISFTQIYQTLAECFQHKEASRLTKLLTSAFDSLGLNAKTPYNLIQSFSIGIIGEIFKNADLSGIPMEKSYHDLCTFLLGCASKDEIKAVAIESCLAYLKAYDAYQKNKKSQAVATAAGYISNHLEEDTTVRQLADIVHMNASYLSVLFKKEMGETISDYVNRLRIERAKELLKQGLKVRDIARKVGYLNPSYFANQFKRTVGYSPAEYRKCNC